MKKHLLFALILLPAILLSQNTTLTLGAELRPRLWLDNGYKKPLPQTEDPLCYITQRTRLNAGFETDNMQVYVSLQDIRVWGDDDLYNAGGQYGNTSSLLLHEGWGKMQIHDRLSVKIGRQLFAYDDQRLLAARNWNDYQVTYDALLLAYQHQGHRLHMAFSYNAGDKNQPMLAPQKFKTIDFLHYQYSHDRLVVSALWLLSANTLTDTTKELSCRASYGANLTWTSRRYKVHVSAYYQHNLNDVSGRISAYSLSGFAGYRFNAAATLAIGYDGVSGNHAGAASATDHRFNILYGARHKFFGYMDYFSTLPAEGLHDLMVSFTHDPGRKLSLYAAFHYLLLANPMAEATNPATSASTDLGQELDLKLIWKVYSHTHLELGYSLYNPTLTLKQLKGLEGQSIRTPQFAYVMVTIKPEVRRGGTEGLRD